MNQFKAFFQISGDLIDFLRPSERRFQFSYSFFGSPSVKDSIEAIGIPHPEVATILANGTTVDFSYNLHPDDTIFVSSEPVSENSGKSFPLRGNFDFTKFILDVHLGKLARKMRLLGFDTLYFNNLNDLDIIQIARSEKRVILSRDIGLLRNGKVEFGYWVRSTNPMVQIKEICKKYLPPKETFSRCLDCNGKLELIEKSKIIHSIPPRILREFNEFRVCSGCKKIYWKGSHYESMKQNLQEMGFEVNGQI